MTRLMTAVVVEQPGGPEVLRIRTVPIPEPAPGWVLIEVFAFGLNRSELHFRRGLAYSGSFPRIPGIEAVGVVTAAPGGEFEPGQQVVTIMGGMQVISTTRRPESKAKLRALGVDDVVIDDGAIADAVRRIIPAGVHAAVELVGTNVLKDTLRAVRTQGTVCFTGMLSDDWTIHEFYPMDWLPNGVRLTAYSGEAADLKGGTLQDFLDAVAAGRAQVPVGHTYVLDEIVQAHRDLENNAVGGKGVVLVSHTPAENGTGRSADRPR